jgi:membrane protein required for beta-lactamase induction
MKKFSSRSRQQGLSFIGLVFLVAILVAVAAIGAQSVPVLLEYQAISKAANKAAAEGNTVAEVKASFNRAAAIDDIKSITGNDLVVTKVNDKVVAGFEYSRDIHLVGPAYLVYRFKK